MSAKIQINNRAMQRAFSEIEKKMNRVPQEAYREWIKNTPVRSGNARRRTQLRGNEIHANYAYASALDSGSSKQSPDGMSAPTAEFVQSRVEQIIRENKS
jgi:hypothetical protein